MERILKSKRLLILLFISSLATIFSCSSERSPLLPKITGQAGEVVLVMNEPIWESEAGRAMGNILASEHPGLTQLEPMFDIARIGHTSFTNIFKTHRNIIVVNVSSGDEGTKMNIRENVWAKPQIVLEINAENTDALHSFIVTQEERILEELVQAEINRIIDYNREFERSSIREHLEENFNLSLIVPRGYNIAVDTDDFVWIRHDPRTLTRDIIQGVFIYQYEYTDPETFTPEFLINKRNQLLRNHIPGPSPNSYMTTEDLVTPLFREFMEDDRYFARLKGLWKLENGFMGGPFISHTTLDEEKNRVVTVECFVFAPGEKKREYLRQVEAIIHTLEIKE